MPQQKTMQVYVSMASKYHKLRNSIYLISMPEFMATASLSLSAVAFSSLLHRKNSMCRVVAVKSNTCSQEAYMAGMAGLWKK